jgi:hypothetical protein
MTEYKEQGDAITAEKITAQARRFDKIRVVKGSQNHNIQQTRLEGDAYCVIDKPLRGVRESRNPTK